MRLAESQLVLEAVDAKEAERKEPEIPACAEAIHSSSSSFPWINQTCSLLYFSFLGAILGLSLTSQLSVFFYFHQQLDEAWMQWIPFPCLMTGGMMM